jgi:very-short-patch-repair endonuclease
MQGEMAMDGNKRKEGNERKERWRGITPELQQAAWLLRNRMTPAEQRLWEALRERRRSGLRFRRQHPVGQFVLDFYCPHHKLVVELDGGVHETQMDQDAARTAFLKAYGYRVIRFRNDEVFSHLESVLKAIEDAANSPTPAVEREEEEAPVRGEPELAP